MFVTNTHVQCEHKVRQTATTVEFGQEMEVVFWTKANVYFEGNVDFRAELLESR